MNQPSNSQLLSNASLVYDFVSNLLAERHLSANTAASYQADLLDVAKFLEAKAISLEEATSDHLLEYITHIGKANYSAASIARRVAALRQFYLYLYTEGQREDNPATRLVTPKLPRNLPKILSEQQVEDLRTAIETLPLEAGEKTRAALILELLYATGMRVSELISIKLNDIKLKAESNNTPIAAILKVTGKGNKERLCPLHHQALEALERYLPYRKIWLNTKNQFYLFCSHGASNHLTRQYVGQLLKKVASAASIPASQLSPHVLRHAFASHMLAAGADIRAIQELMGHADINSTEIYTHLQPEQLEQFVQEHHPLAKK